MKIIKLLLQKTMLVNLLLGFSSGLPLLLTFKTLQGYLSDSAVPVSIIGFFSFLSLAYTLKFLWAPLFDRFSLPFLCRRRGWLRPGGVRFGLTPGLRHDLLTTLAALLNSLQMGFRTLAIEKRSSEVWQVLGVVKTEFGKFGDVLDGVKKKLEQASDSIDKVGVRSRAIERSLQTRPAPAAASPSAPAAGASSPGNGTKP